MLRYAILPISELQIKDKEIHINKLNSCRKSIDKTKVIIHIENLSDAEFETVRYNPKFVFQSEGINELMLTDEWKSKDEN